MGATLPLAEKEGNTMYDSERQVFGRYRSSFRAIHRSLLRDVCDKHTIEHKRMQMPVYHTTVQQYMNSKRDQVGIYLSYELRTPQLDPKDECTRGTIVVAVNGRYRACLYEHRYLHRLIYSGLADGWRSITRIRLRLVSESESYPRNTDDTIEAVGFLCDGELLFEILYPSHVIKSIVELVSAHSRRRVRSAKG